MKLTIKLILFLFPLITLVACGGTAESSQPNTPEGPALLMFYTDG